MKSDKGAVIARQQGINIHLRLRSIVCLRAPPFERLSHARPFSLTRSAPSSVMAPKGGVKKRLASTAAEGDDVAAAAAEVPSASSSHAPPRKSGGVRQRLNAHAGDAPPTQADLPLLKSLKRDWGKGKLSSPKVLEYALGAACQGAVGLDRVSAAAGSMHRQNIQRALISAFGMRKGEP